MTYHLSSISTDHIKDLADNMRAQDRQELWHLARVDPTYALNYSVASSEGRSAVALDDDGRVLIMFGVSPTSVISSIGSPWMFGTPRLLGHARDLLKGSVGFMPLIYSEFDVLINDVWAGNTLSIRYLKALGFTFSEKKTHLMTGAPYYTFSKGSIMDV